jgi:hypothetical protein
MRIEKLTPEQEILKNEYYKNYLSYGTCTKEADWKKAISCVEKIYQLNNKKKPIITLVASPLVAETLLNVYKLDENNSAVNKINDRYKIDIRTDNGLDELTNILNTSYKESLYILKLLDNKKNFYTNYWGQQDGYWIALYKFGQEIGVKYDNNHQIFLDIFNDLCMSCGWLYFFEKVCIICDRPKVLRLNENKVLHCDGSHALEFRDGFKLWALNGITTNQYIAETPGEKLDIDLIANETNVELRSEILKKIGVDRYITKVGGEVIDRDVIVSGEGIENKYELILIKNLGTGTKPMPALKMYYPDHNGNDSGVVLIEWVPREITTVVQAVYFRDTGKSVSINEAKEKYIKPEILR